MFYCTKARSLGYHQLHRHMPFSQATTNDLPLVRHLLERARHVYRTVGHEDLAELIKAPVGIVGTEQGKVWGYIQIQQEERPTTLPADAPSRAFLRLLALAPGRSPSVDTVELLQAACNALPPFPNPVQVICLGGDSWLTQALPSAGFSLTERVQFYRLDRLNRLPALPAPPAELRLQPAQATDLNALAQLDAATFDSLWHLDAKGLWQLFFTYRMQVALWRDELVGYAAVAVNAGEGQLARLAVHPQWQGRGIGRQLLADAIRYAHVQGATEFALNTQVSNSQAQKLYRHFAFRPTGAVEPVYTRLLA